MRFSGKVAIVTGATSGIGRAIAMLFIEDGASVVGVGRTAAGKGVVGGPPERRYLSFAADLTLPETPKKVVAFAAQAFGRVDVLVNAAGVMALGTVYSTDDFAWDTVLRTNLLAPARLIREATPHLREAKGVVVNVSSVNSHRPFGGVAAYNVSKAGLDHLTRTAAVELAGVGVRVNAVNPGVVTTELQRRAGVDNYDEWLERVTPAHPLGRVAKPDEIARIVLWLCSDEAAWITGETIYCDGGRHLTVAR